MTGIELALLQLTARVAKNGFGKMYESTKIGKTAKKTVEAAEDFDFLDIKQSVKNLIKERSEEARLERLNKETFDIGEAFLKKSVISVSASPSLMVANKKPAQKKRKTKKGQK